MEEQAEEDLEEDLEEVAWVGLVAAAVKSMSPTFVPSFPFLL